jgi:hypothetical protein
MVNYCYDYYYIDIIFIKLLYLFHHYYFIILILCEHCIITKILCYKYNIITIITVLILY